MRTCARAFATASLAAMLTLAGCAGAVSEPQDAATQAAPQSEGSAGPADAEPGAEPTSAETGAESTSVRATGTENAEMNDDEREVLAAWEAMQQAMIDKDVDAMRALTTEDKTFTHMSGKTQTREEFFGEIADGTLNYFGYEVHDPHVVIEGDHATLTGSTTLDARVYGASGSWTLPTNACFVRAGGKWVQCN